MCLKDSDLNFTCVKSDDPIEEMLLKACSELVNDGIVNVISFEQDPALTVDEKIFDIPIVNSTSLPLRRSSRIPPRNLDLLAANKSKKKLQPAKRKNSDFDEEQDIKGFEAKRYQKSDCKSIPEPMLEKIRLLLSQSRLKLKIFNELLLSEDYNALIDNGFSLKTIIQILSQRGGSKNLEKLRTLVQRNELSLFYKFDFKNDQLVRILAQPLGFANIKVLQSFLERQNDDDNSILKKMQKTRITGC